MKYHHGVPELTVDEAQRCWLPPREVCDLAAVGDPASNRDVQKQLNNLSDRNHLPFVKSAPHLRAPRLYSLTSAAMLRVFAEITSNRRMYSYAEPIAYAVVKLLHKTIEQVETLSDAWWRAAEWRIVYYSWGYSDRPPVARLFKGDQLPDDGPLDVGVFSAGHLVCSLLDRYGRKWGDELENRGELPPPPVQIGADGRPVEE